MDAKGVLKFLKLGNLSEHLSGYIEDRISLLKLELQEDAASIGVKILFLTIMLLFGICCLLFISIAAAIYLNKVIEHDFTGYLLIGAVYLLLTLIAYGLRSSSKIKSMLYKSINKTINHKV